MGGPFRDRPPTLRSEVIDRPRPDAVLRGRFDRRVTLLTAGPGFGKTALLAAMVADPFADDSSVDLWLEIEPADNDDDDLESALRDAIRGIGGHDVEVGDVPIADLVWSMAPTHVAIVLDDVHHLRPGTDGTAFLAQLIVDLPRNGHLVLSGRRRPPVALTRLQVAGELVELDEADLAFDDDELARFLASRGRLNADVDGELRWPALAELAAVAGAGAVSAYVWEEVVAAIEPDRRRALAMVAPLGVLDDELVRHVTGTDLDVNGLVEGLPLTTATEDGSVRLHDLWDPVLTAQLSPDERAKALRAGGDLLLRRGDLRRAGDAYAAALDEDGIVAVATAAVRRPSTRTDLRVVRHLLRAMPDDVAAGAPHLLLEALDAFGADEERAGPLFEAAAAAAREAGDRDLEALAIWRVFQVHGLIEGLPCRPDMYQRARELAAEGSVLASALVARHEAYVALADGDIDGALARIPDLDGFGPVDAHLVTARLLLDLGRPEDVAGRAVTAEDVADPDQAADADLFLALAIWLRGAMSPEDGFAIADRLADVTVARDVGSPAVNALGLIVLVAIAAGQQERAAALSELATATAHGAVGRRSAMYAEVARAAVRLDAGDEAGATRLFERMAEELPVVSHVPRQFLRALVPLYVLVPSTRSALDRVRVGPSLSIALAAARAIVAARAGDPVDLEVAAWQQPNLLRSHVPPALLVELALVAEHQGVSAAAPVLEVVPDRHRHVRRALDSPHAAIAGAAVAKLASGPVPPPVAVELRVLGPMVLLADGVRVTDPAWGRDRVRRLLALLVERVQVRRRDAAALLWPDLDEVAAGRNLRVNLAHLNAVLQPGRPAAEPPWFIRSEGDMLRLNLVGLAIDVHEFDRVLDAARAADGRGAPAEALAGYLAAVAMYRGQYLEEFADGELGEFERIRVRSAAALAATRAAELLVARGEPEEAIRFADRATAIEPLLERGHLARVRAVAATGDRVAARRTALLLARALTEAGLEPEPITRRVLAALGVDV